MAWGLSWTLCRGLQEDKFLLSVPSMTWFMGIDGWNTCLRSPELVSKGKATRGHVINDRKRLSDSIISWMPSAFSWKWVLLHPEEKGQDHSGGGLMLPCDLLGLRGCPSAEVEGVCFHAVSRGWEATAYELCAWASLLALQGLSFPVCKRIITPASQCCYSGVSSNSKAFGVPKHLIHVTINMTVAQSKQKYTRGFAFNKLLNTQSLSTSEFIFSSSFASRRLDSLQE